MGYEELSTAWSSKFRPFPANNKYLKLEKPENFAITKSGLKTSLLNNADTLLNSPANLLGIRGIRKFAKEITGWKKYEDQKLALSCITNYFMISEKGGTGGGAFRKLYSTFLHEVSTYGIDLIHESNKFLEISKQWENLAEGLYEIAFNQNSRFLLDSLGRLINEIASSEESALLAIKEKLAFP